MTGDVVDTHAFFWYLLSPARLSQTAHDMLALAAARGDRLYIPAIVLVELCHLVDKGKFQPRELDALVASLADPNSGFVVAPLDQQTALAVRAIDRATVPDMPTVSSPPPPSHWAFR